jgi:hypothetical protein
MTSEQAISSVKKDYQIKNVKSFMGMDFPGYNLSLYKGKTKIAEVINDGSGGMTEFRYTNQEVKKEFETMLKSLPEYDDDFGEKSVIDEEVFVYILLNEYEIEKKLKRECKKKTLYRLKGDATDQYRFVKFEFTPKVKEYLIKKYGDNLIEIANERFN